MNFDEILRMIWSLDKKHCPIIIGSFVYKHLIGGDNVHDVDLITTNYIGAYNHFKSSYSNVFCKANWKDAISLGLDGSNITIDIIDVDLLVKVLKQDGLTPINSLVYTTDGVMHVSEIETFRKEIPFSIQDPKKEREWMINNIKGKKYCVWPNMRYKDKEYFRNWSVISSEECHKHYIHTI